VKEKIEHLVTLADKTLSDEKIDHLMSYNSFILSWNDKINLVSRKDTENMFEQHIAPCMVYYLLDLFTDDDKKIIDIGAGGGFPGMINAILHPDREFLFVDGRQKKMNVLNDAIAHLGLKNCKALWGRCEDVSKQKEYAKQFDVCTSRGVGSMKKIIPISLPFLKENGIMLAMKGGDMADEFSEIKKPSRYSIQEFEMDERFHYLERYKTLKIVELGKATS